ncbi:MAG TPA: SPOR domain-containing protein [Rhizomicrobium sp.]|jgi:cell division protein FtsN
MAKIEPGAFKASDGVFDDIDDGDAEEGSRLPLLIVIALLVLAAFGGVVWLAYNQGVQRGRTEAPRPLVAETGGNSSSGHTYKVYEQQAPADPDAGESDVPAPPSDTAKTTPPSTSSTSPMTTAQTEPKTVTVPEQKITAPPPTATAAPRPLITEPTPKPKPVVTETAPKPKPVVTPPPTPVQTETAPAATSGGAYVLQIGAYKSEDEANAAWKSYKAKHSLLSGYAPDVKQVDLGDKGVWYRLRVSSFASKDAASEVCGKLKADGGDCLLAKK